MVDPGPDGTVLQTRLPSHGQIGIGRSHCHVWCAPPPNYCPRLSCVDVPLPSRSHQAKIIAGLLSVDDSLIPGNRTFALMSCDFLIDAALEPTIVECNTCCAGGTINYASLGERFAAATDDMLMGSMELLSHLNSCKGTAQGCSIDSWMAAHGREFVVL